MIEENKFEIPSIILRAYSLIGESLGMAFVGIYSTDTYEALAVADRKNVKINPLMVESEDQTRKLAVEITPSQVMAVVRHIRTADNPLTQINIANLPFVCLRNENGYMTGMSNFNMDIKRESVHEIDESLFTVLHKHYTSEEILEGLHALQISAILKEEFVIIGLCRAGTGSSLKILKKVFEEPENHDHSKTSNMNENFSNNNLSENDNSIKAQLWNTEKIQFCFDTLQGQEADNSLNLDDVELRRPALSAEERKSIREKRETSFCEDWRTATVKSIEALRLIGPFRSEDDNPDRDDRPLIDNAEEIDSRSQNTESEEQSKSESVHIVRRPSRATMV